MQSQIDEYGLDAKIVDVNYLYGEALYKPEMTEGNPIRLYTLDEITEIF